MFSTSTHSQPSNFDSLGAHVTEKPLDVEKRKIMENTKHGLFIEPQLTPVRSPGG